MAHGSLAPSLWLRFRQKETAHNDRKNGFVRRFYIVKVLVYYQKENAAQGNFEPLIECATVTMGKGAAHKRKGKTKKSSLRRQKAHAHIGTKGKTKAAHKSILKAGKDQKKGEARRPPAYMFFISVLYSVVMNKNE